MLVKVLGLRDVIPQALGSVKGSLICKFGNAHSAFSKLIGKEQSLVMQHTSSRCIGVTGVCTIKVEILGTDHWHRHL